MTERRQPSCPECAMADLGPWRSYKGNCPQCAVRQIANTDSSARDPIYEEIERQCGAAAVACIKEKVGLEIVRQRLLREGARP